MKKIFLRLTAIFIMGSFWVGPVLAADYPTKPITMIIPFGAGGMSNVSSRMLGEKMKDILGQPIVFINKPGAGGSIGLRQILKAKPDGYTIASGPMTIALTAPLFLGSPPIGVDDIDYIGSYMPQERVLFALPDKPYKTFDEFLAYSKQHPGELSVGSGGAQWSLEVMKSIAKKEGIEWKYVMFKSGGAASSAVLGGHVDVAETGTGTPAYQSARQGKLNILVDLGSNKVPFFPETKNMMDYGYAYSTMLEYGMVTPKGVPEEIRVKLANALETVMQDEELMKKMGETGFTPRFLSGSEYKKIVETAVNSVPALKEFTKGIE